MDDLVCWLGAQLDEDERIARACSGAPWEIEIPPMVHVSVQARRDNKWKWGRLGYVASVERDDDRAHIAEWDPARVLREIDAKRKIIRLHEITIEKTDAAPFDSYTGERLPDEYSVTCSLCGWATEDPTSACLTLRLLTLPYSDRPGYREEWRP